MLRAIIISLFAWLPLVAMPPEHKRLDQADFQQTIGLNGQPFGCWRNASVLN